MIYNRKLKKHKTKLRVHLLISGVIFLSFSSFIHSRTYESLQAVDDAATVCPSQSVRIDVTTNDKITETNKSKHNIKTLMR
jgi:hypothetical protein